MRYQQGSEYHSRPAGGSGGGRVRACITAQPPSAEACVATEGAPWAAYRHWTVVCTALLPQRISQ
eukprot:COSAG02_NODE_825_length_16730_cov_58.738260_13_plen_65_part_00